MGMIKEIQREEVCKMPSMLIREILEMPAEDYVLFREYLEETTGQTVSELARESEQYQHEVYDDFLQTLE